MKKPKKSVKQRLKEAYEAGYDKGYNDGLKHEKDNQFQRWLRDHPILAAL